MVNLENVLEAVVLVSGVPADKIIGKRRDKEIASARHIFCYLGRSHTGASLLAIGKFLGRDHTTVINSIKVVNDMIDTDYEVFVDMVNECNNYITRQFKQDYEMKVFLPYGVELIKVKGFLEGMGCVVR